MRHFKHFLRLSLFLIGRLPAVLLVAGWGSMGGGRTPQEPEMVKRVLGKAPCIIKIESTDRQIDKLVYELYGLTEEEIKIVEG